MKKKKEKTPFLATALIRFFFPGDDNFYLSGDFKEIYSHILETEGRFRAWFWYWGQVIKSIPFFIYDIFKWRMSMYKNYFKIALRNMKRHKIYSVISITGLAIGMTCCIITALFVNRELSFDRFHKNAERIYRLYYTKVSSENRRNWAAIGNRPPQIIAEELPEIETYVNITHRNRQATSVGEKQFLVNALYAGAEFFEIFSFPLLAGDPKIVLKDPYSVVITPELAQKYFGDNNPLGQTITMEQVEQDLKVTGIMEKMPSNSHIKSDFVLSFNSLEEGDQSLCNVYLLFNSKINREDIAGKINALLAKNNKRKRNYFLQAMTSVYLDADMALDSARQHSDIKYSILLSLLSFLIITISCVNFLNLAGARTLSRLKEIGVRKVTGARNIEMIKLFITESLLFSSISGGLALIITQIFLPQYNSSSFSSGYPLHIDFTGSLTIYLIMFVIIIIIGFIAGYYPALLASSFQPVNIMKSQFSPKTRASFFRKAMIIFQFSVSAFFLIAIFVFMSQIDFMINKKMGVRESNIVIMEVAGDGSVWQKREIFKQEVKKIAGVKNVSLNSCFPGTDKSWEYSAQPLDTEVEIKVKVSKYSVDEDYFSTFDIPLIRGRYFSSKIQSDKKAAVIINESAAAVFGWEDPVGKRIKIDDLGEPTVVGVVKDVHLESMRKQIRPYIFYYEFDHFGFMSIHLQSADMENSIEQIKKVWDSIATEESFSYTVFSEYQNNLYKKEELMITLISITAVLSIIISCLGLFGLACFSMEKRIKEIGIRKVLGASVANTAALLSKDYVKLALFANLIAWPLAYLVVDKWLHNFAYRINLTIWPFISAGFLVLVITLLTVSYKAIRTATANPVESLRYE